MVDNVLSPYLVCFPVDGVVAAEEDASIGVVQLHAEAAGGVAVARGVDQLHPQYSVMIGPQPVKQLIYGQDDHFSNPLALFNITEKAWHDDTMTQ